jgi:hypothetical protein
MMEHIIWDCNAGYNDNFQKAVMEDYKEENPNMTEDEAADLAIELNQSYLDDERANLNISLDNNIVAIATLGLWNGTRSGYRLFNNNIASCLTSGYDPVWYVDNNGDFRCHESHHDGTNEILYREFKDISETQKENFLDKIYNGTVTRHDINRYTRRIGDKIANVYGWEVRKARTA